MDDNKNVNTEVTETKKEGFIKTIRRTFAKFRASKAGRWIIKGGKVVGAGAALYGTYQLGKHSVKPTTVYIESGVEENEEPVAEEADNEEDIQEQD